MNIIVDSVRDPVWLVGGGSIALTCLMLLLVVRSRDVRPASIQKQLLTRVVLGVSIVALLCLCSGVLLVHIKTASLPGATPGEFASQDLLASTLTPSVVASPSATPSPLPTPTPTPRLTRSITQVVTTFCNALDSQDYWTAWQHYSRPLQQAHPQPATFAAWRKFTQCSIPEQSADPSAKTIIDLTLMDGQTDHGRIGEVSYRLTMQIEDQTWKIARVCQIMSEGCFPISWG